MERYIPVAETRSILRAFGYCSCKQDTKERYWGKQFCLMETDISVRPTEMTGLVKEDYLQTWSWIFRSDQTEMLRSIWYTNRNFRSLGLNRRLRCKISYTLQNIVAYRFTRKRNIQRYPAEKNIYRTLQGMFLPVISFYDSVYREH